MAQVLMVAWYGYSYAPGYIHEPGDVEFFNSVKAAEDTFARRVTFDSRFPCTDSEVATAHLYRVNGEGQYSDCPDYEVTVGPRGGVRITRI
jgi:hypothetical protein